MKMKRAYSFFSDEVGKAFEEKKNPTEGSS
jgi:hypothetical protein